jgi:putative Ca2+/H+ antiporter (TMEM165/GDT1 family)
VPMTLVRRLAAAVFVAFGLVSLWAAIAPG